MDSPSRLPSLRRPNPVSGKSRPMSMIAGPMTNIPNLSATSNENDAAARKSKRRSLLPQFNRKGSNEDKPEPGSIKEEEEEQSNSNSSRAASEDTRDSGESTGRRGIDEDRKTMPPPQSRLSRPVSMIPPRGASQHRTKAAQNPVREEPKDAEVDAEAARAQSLAALTGGPEPPSEPSKLARTESSMNPPSSTRASQPVPKPTPSVGGPVIPSRTTSSRTKHPHGRTASKISAGTSTATIHEKQPSMSRPRPLSISSTSLLNQDLEPTAPPSPPKASVLSRPRPTSQMPPPSSRPAFNTYQQHYSPAKSALPKPPVPPPRSSKPTSVIVEDDVPITFDIAKQQIELLQLSLFHQSSIKCTADYTLSAKRKLSKKHTKLRKEYESIRATELVHQRLANLSALESWCPDPGLLVENLQILSLVYSDLTSLMEEGGKHADVISMFELWMNEAEAPEPGTFVQPLPEDWRAAHASLALKLRGIQRNLRVLPPVAPTPGNGTESAGVEVVLKGCRSLVEEMLKELDVMGKIEKEIFAREKGRLEEEVKALVVDGGGARDRWIPVWQIVN